MLYFRYLLLKQGECPELNPELKSYIADHYDVAMNFGKAPLRHLKMFPPLQANVVLIIMLFNRF